MTKWGRRMSQRGNAHHSIAASRETNRYPLRKILDTYVKDNGLVIERLECGHEQHQRGDMFGPTLPIRRRCWRCGKLDAHAVPTNLSAGEVPTEQIEGSDAAD